MGIAELYAILYIYIYCIRNNPYIRRILEPAKNVYIYMCVYNILVQ